LEGEYYGMEVTLKVEVLKLGIDYDHDRDVLYISFGPHSCR